MDAHPEQHENRTARPRQFGPDDARDLLARTVELPPDQRGLLTVLREYRSALVALLTSHDAARDSVQVASTAEDRSQ